MKPVADPGAALASQRVRERMTERLRQQGIRELRVLQASVREPVMFASTGWLVPEAKMSGDAIEVLVEPVTGENG